MSIRKKLLLSYAAMVAIPVLVFAATAILLFSLVFRNEGTPPGWGPDRGNPFAASSELRDGLAFVARYDAGRLLDAAFLRSIDAELTARQSGLVVERAGQTVYATDSLQGAGTLERIRAYSEQSGTPRFHPALKVQEQSYTVARSPIAFPDQSSGELYVLTRTGDTPAPFRFVPLLFLMLLLVVGATNGVLTWLVSRSILNPLRDLGKAAQHIKEGNLDVPLTGLGKDELGDVGRTFEEMRLRLRESIATQLHYEDNRKALLAHISHDLKTPITAISHCAEGLQDGIADTPEKRSKYYSMIRRKASDMNRLIEELFLFSKLDMGKVPFHMEPVELNAYLESFVDELGQDPSRPAMETSLAAESSAPVYVMADREKLRRVLLNIVDNSVKYMVQEPRRLDIRLTAGPTEATVSIRDNGTGMDRAGLPHIFESFYRDDPARSADTGGSGLGLAIVEQIVAEHGGRVWADSAPGEGMCITIQLKLTKGPSEP